ncbi:hypothetical protein Hanom_Chr01g00036941 [Helianthus anomalus]
MGCLLEFISKGSGDKKRSRFGESLSVMFGVEEEMEEQVLSWEGEFRGKLEGLLEYGDVGECDPKGDIAILEALLEGKPMMVIEPTPYEETKCGGSS